MSYGNTHQKDQSLSMHQFPQDPKLKSEWIKALKLDDSDIKRHHQLCSRHFPQGDRKNMPSSSLGNAGQIKLSELTIIKPRKTCLVQVAMGAQLKCLLL